MEINKLLILFGLLQLLVQNKLLIAIEVFRHGARESVSDWYNPVKTNISGELTSVGIRQHFNLGLLLKKRYIQEHKLIDRQFNPLQIYARSTDVNRTLMSLNSQLNGLFYQEGPELIDIDKQYTLPPFQGSQQLEDLKTRKAMPQGIMSFPIHTISKYQDYLLIANDKIVCPYLKQLDSKQMQKKVYTDLVEKYSYVYDWVSKQFNVSFNSQNRTLGQLSDVFENYLINEWKNKDYPLQKDSQLFKDLKFTHEFAKLYENYGTNEQLKLMNSELLSELMNWFQLRIQNKITERLVLYSAHDTTLLYLMSALNLTSYQCHYQKHFQLQQTSKYCFDFPSFASSLIFELHEINSNYYVQVLYQGQAVKICQDEKQLMCRLDLFQEIQKNFYQENYKEICWSQQNMQQDLQISMDK